MSNLLTASEAFAALQKGKTVLCRFADDMSEFEDLDQFTPYVFVRPGFEFCIKIETIELAGITFTKPLTVDELEVGTEVFVINPAGFIEKHVYQGVGYGIITMVDGGFAQRDLENARLQYQALCKLLGGKSIKDAPLKTIELEMENNRAKKRNKKSSQVKDEISVVEETTKDIGDALECAVVITEGSYVSPSEDFLVQPTAKPATNAQFEILLDAIRICNSEKELDSTCANLEKEGFTPAQIKTIDEAKQNRLTELDAQEIDAANPIEMPANYKSLKQSISDATTPEAVNAVMNYTGKWTEAQRNVLVLEMHKKLTELDQGKPQEKEPPSLLAQIQVAPDFVTLDALVIEVSKRETLIQPKYMDAVKKRRFELENSPVNETDYLLEEPF